jgi:hypothetical protein
MEPAVFERLYNHPHSCWTGLVRTEEIENRFDLRLFTATAKV